VEETQLLLFQAEGGRRQERSRYKRVRRGDREVWVSSHGGEVLFGRPMFHV